MLQCFKSKEKSYFLLDTIYGRKHRNNVLVLFDRKCYNTLNVDVATLTEYG